MLRAGGRLIICGMMAFGVGYADEGRLRRTFLTRVSAFGGYEATALELCCLGKLQGFLWGNRVFGCRGFFTEKMDGSLFEGF